MTVQRLKEMSERMVVGKDADLLEHYLGGQLHRVWETAWPSWRQLPGFENY